MTPPPTDDETLHGRRRRTARPSSVTSATRVIVGFPFATIKVQDTSEAAAVAAVLAGLCHALATNRSAAAMQRIADDADALVKRLTGES